MKVLLDLNVVLDVILNRQQFLADSPAVWNAQQSSEFEGDLAATEFTNQFYIVERVAGNSKTLSAVGACLNSFAVVAVDRTVLHAAESSSGTHFEDNVCIACATSIAADWIRHSRHNRVCSKFGSRNYPCRFNEITREIAYCSIDPSAK